MTEVTALNGIAQYGCILRPSQEIAVGLADVFSPIRHLVKPGETVVIKPNLVADSRIGSSDEWVQVITNGAIIERAVQEAVLGLQGKGKVLIVDAPQTDSDYEKIAKRIDLDGIVERCSRGTTVEIEHYDLREEQWITREGVTVGKKKLRGDPLGYREVNLGTESVFASKKNKHYYGADYDQKETSRYHNDADNIYVMSNTVLSCDTFINLPKLKPHKLGGITCCLKNIVGTCVVKNSLPHHTTGSPEAFGDQFPLMSGRTQAEGTLKKIAASLLKYKNPLISYPIGLAKKATGNILGEQTSATVRNGSWYGNDTIWRTILDLNRILFYADKQGTMKNTPQRKYYAIVDGVVAGEGDGPMDVDAKEAGILIAGSDPVAIDAVASTLIGFDYRTIPTVIQSFAMMRWPLTRDTPDDIRIKSNKANWNGALGNIALDSTLSFKPHFGWLGHIEMENRE